MESTFWRIGWHLGPTYFNYRWEVLFLDTIWRIGREKSSHSPVRFTPAASTESAFGAGSSSSLPASTSTNRPLLLEKEPRP